MNAVFYLGILLELHTERAGSSLDVVDRSWEKHFITAIHRIIHSWWTNDRWWI